MASSIITDGEAKIITGVICAILLATILSSWHELLLSPGTMIPILIGAPLIAYLIWHEWGRTSQHRMVYALVLAVALALPLGAVAMIMFGWVAVELGYPPLTVAAVFWLCGVFVIFRKIMSAS